MPLSDFYLTKTNGHISSKCRKCTSVKKDKSKVRVNIKSPPGHKFCHMCNTQKEINEFTKTGKQCKPCVVIKNKNYQSKNRKTINATAYKYNKARIKIDVNYKLSKLLRARLYNAVKRNYKSGSAIRDLGCSINELKIYLEQRFQDGMTWENHGKWHIDHIKPLSKFDLTNEDELKKAVHYTNLQPLWAADNYKKNDTYIEKEEQCVKN